MGLVYRFINKVNGKSYIGKTMSTFDDRLTFHLYASRHDDRLTIFSRALAKYMLAGFNIQFLEIDVETDIELSKLEIFYIAYFNTNSCKGGYGYNMTDGGEGTSGYIWTAEQREHQRQARLAYYARCPEAKMEASKYFTNLWQNAEYRGSLMSLCPIDNNTLSQLGSTMTWLEMAKHFDVSSTTVKRWFKDNSIQKHITKQRAENRKSWTKLEEKQLLELRLQGELVREIAVVLDRSENSVLKRMQKLCDEQGIVRTRFNRRKHA